jgi:hypothetical protein
MKAKLHLGHLFVAALIFPVLGGADNTGCQSQPSSDVNPDKIYQAYWLYYDTNSNTTFARAQFRFGSGIGTTLELSDGAEVTFNGKTMSFNALLDWQEVILPGKVLSGTFTYTDTTGKAFTQQVVAINEIAISPLPTTIAKGQALSLTWSGGALESDGVAEFIIAEDRNRLNFARTETRNAGATNVVMGADELARMPSGADALLSLRRWREFPLQQGSSVGGKLTVTYQGADKTVPIR